jgi:hypothetical protein
MHRDLLGQTLERPQGLQRPDQERGAVAVGRRRTVPKGTPRSRPPPSGARCPACPGPSGSYRPSRRRRGPSLCSTVDGYIRQPQADGSVVSGQRRPPQPLHHARLDPLVAPTAQEGARRAQAVGDPPVGAAEREDLNQLLEDRPVRDARSVAAQRVIDVSFGQQGAELSPNGLDEVWWHSGYGLLLLRREASDTPRTIEHPCPTYSRHAPYWRKLLFSASRSVELVRRLLETICTQ